MLKMIPYGSQDGNGSRNKSSNVVRRATTPERWPLFTGTLRIFGSWRSSHSSWRRLIRFSRCWTHSFSDTSLIPRQLATGSIQARSLSAE
jgi:hypothetical protein